MYGLAVLQLILTLVGATIEDVNRDTMGKTTMIFACAFFVFACALPFMLMEHGVKSNEWNFHLASTTAFGAMIVGIGYQYSFQIARFHAIAVLLGICLAQLSRWYLAEQVRAENERQRRAAENARRTEEALNRLFTFGVAAYTAYTMFQDRSHRQTRHSMPRSNSAPADLVAAGQ